MRDDTLIIRNLNSCLRTLEFKGKKICVHGSGTKYVNLFVPNTFRGTIQVVPLLCISTVRKSPCSKNDSSLVLKSLNT